MLKNHRLSFAKRRSRFIVPNALERSIYITEIYFSLSIAFFHQRWMIWERALSYARNVFTLPKRSKQKQKRWPINAYVYCTIVFFCQNTEMSKTETLYWCNITICWGNNGNQTFFQSVLLPNESFWYVGSNIENDIEKVTWERWVCLEGKKLVISSDESYFIRINFNTVVCLLVFVSAQKNV